MDNKIKKINLLFYYLQDVLLEIEVALAHLDPSTKKLIEACDARESSPSESGKNNQIFWGSACRTMQSIIILSVCRISEAVKSSGAILRELAPDSSIKLNEFIKRYYTQNVREYRNEYLVHPYNKNKELKPVNELVELLHNIQGTKSSFWYKTPDQQNEYYIELMRGCKDHPGLKKIIFSLGDEIEKNTQKELYRP